VRRSPLRRIAAASRTLGLVEQTLFNWVKAHREGTLQGADNPVESDRRADGDQPSARTCEMIGRPKHETVLLVAGGTLVLVGWFFWANVEYTAKSALGCGHPMAPNLDGSPGGCLGATLAQRLMVQVAGMALTIAGAIAVLLGALKRRMQ
jgi:hypothetical protein